MEGSDVFLDPPSSGSPPPPSAGYRPAADGIWAAGDRVTWRRDHRRRRRDHHAQLRDALVRVQHSLAVESEFRLALDPDPADVADAATLPGARLWERRRTDPDLLCVRLGLTDAPSWSHVRDGTASRPAGLLREVPLRVNVQDGPLGVAGPPAVAHATVRWVLIQLAVRVAPPDLEFALLLAPSTAQHWRWMRWLPHLRCRVAVRPDEHRALVRDLLAEAAVLEGGESSTRVLLVVDLAGDQAAPSGLSPLLTRTAARVSAVCVGERIEALPVACSSAVSARRQ